MSITLSDHRPRRERPEARIQKAIVRHLRRHFDVRVVHVANGGLRGRLEAINLKDEGVDAGHPDLVIYAPGARTFHMEVKSEVGRLSDRQVAYVADLERMGFPVVVVRSLEDALAAADRWSLPEKRAAQRSAAALSTGF